jgi:serine/threonine protein kinase
MALINFKYKLLNEIGKGSFGTIYRGENIRTREKVAIKVEAIEHGAFLLKNESIIYRYLNNMNGIPAVKWFGKDDTNYYMVINLLGKSLQNIKDEVGCFTLNDALKIGVYLINLIQNIHEKGLVHRDIKPDNFLFGLDDTSKIYIIDFGFCKSYVGDDKHIPMKKTDNLIGSRTYASINAHNFDEISRRDDLESLCYTLIYLVLGKLDWQMNSSYNYEHPKLANIRIRDMKTQMIESSKFLPDKSLIPTIFINSLKYIRTLEFDAKPDYAYLIEIFSAELENSTFNRPK